jgi:plasmid stabilization system protein ParE
VNLGWHPLAKADLFVIATYIASESPAAAQRVISSIREQTGELRVHPMLGRPGRVAGTGELVVLHPPFVVAYRIDLTGVTVLRVLHGARRRPESM